MAKARYIGRGGLVAILIWSCFFLNFAIAQNSSQQLIISQLKVTSSSGQFAALYNNSSSIIDLETVQLQYFNNYDLSKATSTKLITLSGNLAPQSYAIVNDGPITMCHQAIVVSASLSFSSTAGFLQVGHFASTSGPQTSIVVDDYVGWSKTAAIGAQTLPSNTSAFLNRQSLQAVVNPGTGTWQILQPDINDPCSLSSFITIPGTTGDNLLLPPTQPPATIISITESGNTNGSSSNSGLMAPVITELLPNPAEPLTDADDEFVEIYNPNDRTFDLSGYGLQTSLTSSRVYKFPNGISLPAKSFQVFTSADSSFALSNSGGHVRLVDPSENVINQSEPYGSAKEGQSWALANGKWYWTSKPSAATANIIDQSGGQAGSNNSRSSGSVRSASTAGSPTSSAMASATSQNDPLHPATLAVVGGAVILYAGYEYRNDVANQLHRLRRYREARRASGQSD